MLSVFRTTGNGSSVIIPLFCNFMKKENYKYENKLFLDLLHLRWFLYDPLDADPTHLYSYHKCSRDPHPGPPKDQNGSACFWVIRQLLYPTYRLSLATFHMMKSWSFINKHDDRMALGLCSETADPSKLPLFRLFFLLPFLSSRITFFQRSSVTVSSLVFLVTKHSPSV